MIIAVVHSTSSTRRSTMPSPIEMPAASDPMPIRNGVTVEPITPIEGATPSTATATIRS